VRTVAGYLNQGYRRIKIKIKPGRDVADAQAVRKAFPEIQLQVDANSAYTLDSAVSLLPLDDLGLLLIEQPLDEDDFVDHSKLQRQFITPLCLDESILTPRHARQAIEMGACRVVNIKNRRVGGLSQAIAIHDLCSQHNIPVWCGGMLETGVGRAANLALASLPNFRLPAISPLPTAITMKILPTSASHSTRTAPLMCQLSPVWGYPLTSKPSIG